MKGWKERPQGFIYLNVYLFVLVFQWVVGGGCGGGCGGGGGGGCSSCCGGGGGGGGGCGGGGGGCCGRKKRETAVQPHYKADDTPCPQAAWKQLLEDGINENDAIASVNSIQTALFRRYETEQKFLVVCATADENKINDATANKVHFSSSGDGYCNVFLLNKLILTTEIIIKYKYNNFKFVKKLLKKD
ncbi:hypothetical protein Mgra_00005073 [Meloidogyne graminicola]|uniref:Ground-like domain-containing protein n=1 Tax=Meloidogyne graminicola TaxID=189291 RepID=A0A8S9ZQK7_9BILA|nr:hypothetical protein Mgra_00005073 [Meloidogyne graminicola]